MSIIPNVMSIHELLYDDFVDVYRVNKDFVDEHGVNRPVRELVYEKVKCKLSITTMENPADKEEGWRNKLSLSKIFSNPNIQFQAGDIVEIFRLDRVTNEYFLAYKGFAGKSSIYFNHRETEVSEELIN